MFLLILLVLSSPDWTQQHLTYPVDYCKLAAVCIHDNRMVCATTEDGCSRRTFIDQCDMYEYNCDFGARFDISPCDIEKNEVTERPEATPVDENRPAKKCMRPSSWFTTVKGETRDFHRIIEDNKLGQNF
ncbi:uncharacterized protein LOC113499288 isoform X1 [Trichoplusia ni]|uniref:Uncharacterized protein LOC113499288 isoform X1 n=1 Tax=Trichoplusia ni TaxID=7111 RepID=A0A7E5W4C2_TRINI|nr:uncharacterized protein LOC113499288 isoform X1 [Trichoplusia ni]